jgi:hypothetical protein
MKINLNSIDALIKNEVNKAVEKILESNLDLDKKEQEAAEQKRIASQIKNRGLNASEEKKLVDEAEVEDDDNEKDSEKNDSKRKDRTGGKGTAQSSKIKTPSSDVLEDPKVDSFIDKLNVLRGGKSLKDPVTRKSLQQYLDSINVKEKKTLLIFLTAMSQIMAGVKMGAEALDPSEVGMSISKDKSSKKTSKDTTPVKKTASQAPILVGEVQNKVRIKKILEAYRKCN